MIDWVNKFLQTYCVYPGFAISIDEMMKLFKGQSNMTHIMNEKQTYPKRVQAWRNVLRHKWKTLQIHPTLERHVSLDPKTKITN